MTRIVSNPVVLGEHTLGVITDHQPDQLSVLHGSVLKGGYDWRDGPVPIALRKHEIRPATKADFEAYLVDWRGYLPEDG